MNDRCIGKYKMICFINYKKYNGHIKNEHIRQIKAGCIYLLFILLLNPLQGLAQVVKLIDAPTRCLVMADFPSPLLDPSFTDARYPCLHSLEQIHHQIKHLLFRQTVEAPQLKSAHSESTSTQLMVSTNSNSNSNTKNKQLPSSDLAQYKPLLPLPKVTHLNHAIDCSTQTRDFSCAFKKVIPSVLRVASGYKGANGFVPVRVGSGVVWSEQHHIITNAHVVESGKILRALTHERHVIPLKVIGINKKLDVALLAAKKTKHLASVPSITMAQQAPLPGHWVAAIGHPYQMSYSLSTGAVSALHRNDVLEDWKGSYPGFIQTDLTLNPGNSGGPLVNLRGEMLGLNTAILGSGQGLSFALPLSRLLPVVKALQKYGSFDRSFVGMQLRSVSYKRAKKARISVHQAVRIHRVVPYSPADIAGLMKDDLITHVNDKAFSNPEELSWYFISSPASYPIMIHFIRMKNKQRTFKNVILVPSPIRSFSE